MKDLNQCINEAENKLSRGETDKLYPIQRMIVEEAVKTFIDNIECTCDSDSPDTMCDYCYLLSSIHKENIKEDQ